MSGVMFKGVFWLIGVSSQHVLDYSPSGNSIYFPFTSKDNHGLGVAWHRWFAGWLGGGGWVEGFWRPHSSRSGVLVQGMSRCHLWNGFRACWQLHQSFNPHSSVTPTCCPLLSASTYWLLWAADHLLYPNLTVKLPSRTINLQIAVRRA